jgi:hypothetical protein
MSEQRYINTLNDQASLLEGGEIFVFDATLSLEPKQPPIQWVPVDISPVLHQGDSTRGTRSACDPREYPSTSQDLC